MDGWRPGRTALAMLATLVAGTAQAQIARESWYPGTSSITEPELIPAAFRGRWAMSLRECTDADGVRRIEIRENGLDLAEAGGRLMRVTQAGAERSIRLMLAYEGEGEFWDRTEIWSLNEIGDRLTITSEPEGNPVTFRRCD